MVKLVYCICRKQGLSRDEFRRYWAEVHGPIGLRIPGLRKLVQSYAIPASGDARPGAFDGMAELWLSTADEAHFVDPARGASFVSEERQIL
jgi:uncharacterized protein (TIGR02118 family)